MTRPSAVPVAPSVDSERILPGHQFVDAFQVPAPPGIDAVEAARMAFSHVPAWIRALMGLRNRLGRVVGLKPGPPGGFPVIRQSADEVLMGFNDKHLDFRVVVAIAGGRATLTTVVRWHNAWGRAYLATILPFHRVIAARMLEGVA